LEGMPHPRKLEAAKEAEKTLKKVGDPDEELLGQIFKPVQSIGKGADPKSILCAFFKQGTCGKGDKCKFSHDLTIERKAEKRSLYCDMREGEEDADGDTMENWDDEKLAEVVAKKHGKEGDLGMPKTDIICKFFLDAVEKQKYGWFWQCPNGGNCHYRHALPPGFILKRDAKKLAEETKKLRDEFTLEDLIEKERAALNSNTLTKVTLESFMMWKRRKLTEKKEALQKDQDKKLKEFKAGNKIGLSGRDMFTFNPELANEAEMYDDEGDDTVAYQHSTDDGDEENDQVVTNDLSDINYYTEYFNKIDDDDKKAAVPDVGSLKINDVGGAAAGPSSSVPIDEDLFNDDELFDDEEDD